LNDLTTAVLLEKPADVPAFVRRHFEALAPPAAPGPRAAPAHK
jgi:hypothetical protein